LSNENEITETRMSIWEHLGELLSRLKIILFSVLVSGLLIGFFPTNLEEIFSSFDFYSPTILNYTPFISIIMERMKSDLLPSGAELIAGNLMDTAYIYLILSFMVGIVVCSPLIAYELYAFFNPALLESEKKTMGKYISTFIALFVFGIVLGYTMILPLTFRIIMWFIFTAGALPYINIKDFFMMIITLIIGSGLLYTAPVFLVLLAQKGIITSQHLTENRKLIYVGFLVVIAVITPDPTIITDLIIMVPFILVFEMAIIFSRRVEKKNE
jgi:sec-independent protein translocase protein TatC